MRMRIPRWALYRIIRNYTCVICNHFCGATSMTGVLKHIGLVHAHEPNFHVSCGIKGCPRTYKNYYSFRKHLQPGVDIKIVFVSKPFSKPSLEFSTDCVDEMTDFQLLGMTNKEDTSRITGQL